MSLNIHIDPGSKTPIYKQLLAQFENAIHSGRLSPGDMLSSMNELSARTGISKETVKKAYGILAEKGLIVPKQGKGFYVADADSDAKLLVLVLFDKISVYKQTLFNSLADTLGDKAELTILTHNQSVELLEYYLDNCLDRFDYYVITPHFPLDEASQARVTRLLSRIPNRKLVMLDRLLPGYPGNYGAVYQDFENDVYYGLTQGLDRFRQSSQLKVITLPTSLYGESIRKGIERFCSEHGIPVEYLTQTPPHIGKGDTFLILNSQLDSGLASLARQIKAQNLTIGKDVRIISYNEFDLYEVVLSGLTTISADFRQMGRLAGEMILDKKPAKIHCDFQMTRRSTF
ncbi:MAG: GntR family transcriptional regulator [Bacteroidales bacterium]|nr:GntR family transcriptional regulator [Bacteroidales bacterium]